VTMSGRSHTGARPLSPAELEDLEEHFAACDTDGNGRVSLAEFSRLLDRLGSQTPLLERQARFGTIDVDGDGTIDTAEFIEWWRGP
jgi:Ca2+-binding EF-hand superfamily protein